MKLFGSISELVSTVFRQNTNTVTLRPNQATTYGAARDIQLPPGDTDHVVVSASSTQTLTNKTLTSPTVNGGSLTGVTVSLADTGSHNLSITANSSTTLTADRVLTIDVKNANKTLALGGNLSTGSSNLALELTGNTDITLPTTGTLATLAGTETLSNKNVQLADGTVSAPSLNFISIGNTTTGAYLAGAQSLGFAAGGVAAGNVGSDTGWTLGRSAGGSTIHHTLQAGAEVIVDIKAGGANAANRSRFNFYDGAGTEQGAIGTSATLNLFEIVVNNNSGSYLKFRDFGGFDLGRITPTTSGVASAAWNVGASGFTGTHEVYGALDLPTVVSGAVANGVRLSATNTLALSTNSTDALLVDGSQVSTHVGGVKFANATIGGFSQSPMTAYVESGSWTPVGTSATPGTESNANQTGRFTRIGNMVFFIGTTAYTKGTASGTFKISGLPFTTANFGSNLAGYAGTVQTIDLAGTALGSTAGNMAGVVTGFVESNATTMRFAKQAASGEIASVVASDLDATFSVWVSGYFFC